MACCPSCGPPPRDVRAVQRSTVRDDSAERGIGGSQGMAYHSIVVFGSSMPMTNRSFLEIGKRFLEQRAGRRVQPDERKDRPEKPNGQSESRSCVNRGSAHFSSSKISDPFPWPRARTGLTVGSAPRILPNNVSGRPTEKNDKSGQYHVAFCRISASGSGKRVKRSPYRARISPSPKPFILRR